MSRLFSRGNWTFGNRNKSTAEDLNDATHRSLIQDESFDVGSNAPVYLSRREAGEWMLDNQNGQPVEIIEDDQDNDDDKFSDVASSVVSSSTVAESREFWLNCLKENGVDMTTSLPHSSPRKSLSQYSKGSLSTPRSPDPLTLHDDNTLQNSSYTSQQEDDRLCFATNEQPAIHKSVATKDESHVSYSIEEKSSKYVESVCSESTTSAEAMTDDKTQDPLDWQNWSLADGIPFENMLTLESQNDQILESQFGKNSASNADRMLEPTLVDTHVPEIEDTSMLTYDENSHAMATNGGNGPPIEKDAGQVFGDLLPVDPPKENAAQKASPVQVTTVVSDETFDDSLSFAPSQQVTTATSNDTNETGFTESDVPGQYCPGDSGSPYQGLEHLVSSSLDHSPFVDDSLDNDSANAPWRPKAETKDETNTWTSHEAKYAPSNPVSSDRGETQKPSSAQFPCKTTKAGATTTTDNSVKAETTSKDPYNWMYIVWYRKGLMKKMPPNYSGPIDLQVKIVPRSPIPSMIAGAVEPPTEKTKNGMRKNSEPLVTPREAFVTLDYKAVQANDEDATRRPRRSLPVNIRGSAKREGGRKSFESIMKMWRNKSEDQSNGLFSPEQYLAHEGRERSKNPPKTRPTQHSQLLCIAGKTGSSRRQGSESNPRPEQSQVKVTPRSASVDGAKKLAASVESKASTGVDSATKSPHLSYSPVRDFTIDEQLQRPPKRSSSGKRRKSLPFNKSAEKEEVKSRRETINPKEHFRRHVAPGRSHSDYKSVIKNDYKSVVRTFLASVEEHKELDEARAQEVTSNLSGIDPIPHESAVDVGGELHEKELITPRNTDQSNAAPLSAQKSASKDSPWTEQVVRQLKEVPIGSGERKSSWREDRPWREDLVKRRVSDFSDSSVVSAVEDGPCHCSSSVFSGNDALIDFFLPQMGMACNCGKRAMGLRNPEEPTALENILRPWQVQFLAAFGIQRGDQLVKAHHRSAKALANALRQYRRKHGMTPFRTKSCGMALQIWSKTSKAYVRSIRKQLTTGTTDLKVPNTLYIISSFLEKMHEMHSPMPRNPNTVHEDEASV